MNQFGTNTMSRSLHATHDRRRANRRSSHSASQRTRRKSKPGSGSEVDADVYAVQGCPTEMSLHANRCHLVRKTSGLARSHRWPTAISSISTLHVGRRLCDQSVGATRSPQRSQRITAERNQDRYDSAHSENATCLLCPRISAIDTHRRSHAPQRRLRIATAKRRHSPGTPLSS